MAISIILLVTVIPVVVAVVGIVVFLSWSRRQSNNVREECGRDLKRVALERGTEKEAERELRARYEQAARESDTAPLRWRSATLQRGVGNGQTNLRGHPLIAFDQANRVVTDLLTERNILLGSHQEAAEAVGVMPSKAAQYFRDAQRIHAETAHLVEEESIEDQSIEKVRQGIQKDRSVYERLVLEQTLS